MDRAQQAALDLIELIQELDDQEGEKLPIGQWTAFRAAFSEKIHTLRVALTPSGDAIFMQVPAGRRAYQCLVLACEHWEFQGLHAWSQSFRLVVVACEACGEVMEAAAAEVAVS